MIHLYSNQQQKHCCIGGFLKIYDYLSDIIGQAASDVFTQADVNIQKTIEYNLKQLYPRAKIIGTQLISF
jgi:3'-phosphoadenosine 5'-phosphosulfate (PAPS) 3'-phosphatase